MPCLGDLGLDVSADGRFLAFSDLLDDRVSIVAVPSYGTARLRGRRPGDRPLGRPAQVALPASHILERVFADWGCLVVMASP